MNFYYSENRGAAFGMLQGKQGFFFLIAAAVVSGSVVGGLPDAGRETVSAADVQLVSAPYQAQLAI